MNLSDSIIAMRRLLRAGITPHLVGKPGVGKSEAVLQMCEQIASETGEAVGLAVLNIGSYDTPDLQGFIVPTRVTPVDGGEPRLVSQMTEPDWMVRISKFKRSIVFLDEFLQGSQANQKAMAPMILERRIGGHQLSENVNVVMASNRAKDRSGAVRSLALIDNRVCTLEVDPDMQSWVDWAEARSVSPLAISFAKKNPAVVFAEEVPVDPGPFCTPRSFVRLVKELRLTADERELGLLELPSDRISQSIARGMVGDGAARQFFAHIKFAELVPDPDDVIKNPEKAKVPDASNPSALMIAASMCSHIIEMKNAANVLTYIMRLPPEFQIAFVRGVQNKGGKAHDGVLTSPHFAKWAAANKNVVMAALGAGRLQA